MTRTAEDIRLYQFEYYKRNNFKVYCEVCDKYVNSPRMIHHQWTDRHLRLSKGIIKQRKTRSDRGIPKKPKPPRKEFIPEPIIIYA
jgi:hypothetical protein